MRTFGILLLTAGAVIAQQVPQPAPGTAGPGVSVKDRAILDLETRLAEMLRQYTESNPAILKMKAQLDALRAQPGLAPTQAEKARLDSQKARLAAELARANADQARAQAEQARSRTLIPAGLPDNWWRNAGMVSLLRLTPSQVSQMEDNFQQHRLKLIDLNASLEKEEVTLEPLVSADTLDEVKLTAQLDRVAQARAELEKYRGRMLVGIRRVLDPEQWRQLNETRFVLRKPPVR